MELNNDRAEYSIKPLSINRKILFTHTPGGAKGSAVMISLIQTTLNNKLDPWRYLSWLMQASDKAEK